MSLQHRRDILKLFGVGASIIPIIGGQPVLAAEAKLIEEPKLEMVEGISYVSWVDALQAPLSFLASKLLYNEQGVIDGHLRHLLVESAGPQHTHLRGWDYNHLVMTNDCDYCKQQHPLNLPLNPTPEPPMPLCVWALSAMHWRRAKS